jgi:trehalose 6-phosphate phosphatase
MEHLFSALPKILEQTQRAKQVLFLSDYDGTLTPIVEKPELALLSESTRMIIQTLSRYPHFTVGIVSGRSLVDLKERVNVHPLIYAGNHGYEIQGPGISFINPIADELKLFLRILHQILVMTIGSIKGVLIEDKGFTLSVHYRQVEAENIPEITNFVEKTITGQNSRGLVKVTPGKKVYEIKPALQWDKGKAIQLLMKRYGKGGWQSGLLPIYLGDDLTDEDGFRVIEKYGRGISVHVGEPKPDSAARYFLNSPEEVHIFMCKLVDSVQRGFLCEQYLTTS